MTDGDLDPRAELKEAMGEFAPELRLLDCGWVLEGETQSEAEGGLESTESDDVTVDWVAVDPSGRLNLLLWLGPDGESFAEEPISLALEVLHRAQHQLPFILSHLGNCGIRPELAPRLVLAAPSFPAGTLRKLSVLGEERIRLIEIHEVRTDSGVSHHMISRWPENEESIPVGPEAFMARLPEGSRALAELIMQRLDHVDEHVGYGGMGVEYMEWRLRSQVLCALELRDGQLQASVAGAESAPLSEEDGGESFIESVLQRYFEILEDEPDGAGEEGGSLVDQGMGVVLSHEELDAFL